MEVRRTILEQELVDALMQPEAYPEPSGHIELIQTHISFVFLTEKYVYKIKKPVNFGFLDFSTLEKRRFYCEKELELNQRLCGDMYLEVVPINKATNIKIKGTGETVEYGLKMRRLPQEKLMSRLLDKNEMDKGTIGKIAHIIADFHSTAQTSDAIAKFGNLDMIKLNWEENFQQTEQYRNKTISTNNFNIMRKKTQDFMAKNEDIFENRIKANRIRDCHGDIHTGNIFIADRIYIFDAVEFNERFRYSDVASDAAFLAMDLDFKRRADLSSYFIKKYLEYSKDTEMAKLLPFYECYRAYVRGKVVSFRLDDPNICDREKNAAINEAQAYFKLARTYADKL